MNTCIINLENVTKECINKVKDFSKEDKVYLFYDDNTTLQISNYIELVDVTKGTNVEFCKVQNASQLLVHFGYILSQATANDKFYVGKNIEVPDFLEANGTHYVLERIKREYNKREKVEESEKKNTNKSAGKTKNKEEDRPKRQYNRKTKKDKEDKEVSVADTIKEPIKKRTYTKRTMTEKQNK